MMYLSISSRFTYKDRPKDYRGITSESIKWDRKMPFSQLAFAVTMTILEWYAYMIPKDEAIKELGKLRDRLTDVIENNQEPEDDDA